MNEAEWIAGMLLETAMLAGLCAEELAKSGLLSEPAAEQAYGHMKSIARMLEDPNTEATGAAVIMNSFAEIVRRGPAANRD